MGNRDEGARAAAGAIAVAALALAGIAFALTPLAQRLDHAFVDQAWRTLRDFDVRSAPDDIVIVGIDEATLRSIPEPPGMWHAALGAALARLAAQQPRAIGLAYPLPERSFESVKPGVDRALFDGLATAVESGPLVAALGIDARTREARAIHTPYLALLGESRLGLDLVARDADGAARRYALLVPTEDGGFPTLVARLCRALERACDEGLIHYALGKPYTYVPLQNLLAMDDPLLLRRLFRDRIVLLGETRAYHDRIEVPVNLAAWESGARTSPAVVVHAQTLRTALAQAAPQPLPRPVPVVLVSLAALLFLMRDWRLAAVTALLAAGAGIAAAALALHAGTQVPIAAFLASLALAPAARAFAARRRQPPPRAAPNIRHIP
ncbi:MAG TPA: CHASE2 domain-containing protein [Myxococcota bacterium]|nr:CHASE2 domain-containing protein [Myxococcota bacterium]